MVPRQRWSVKTMVHYDILPMAFRTYYSWHFETVGDDDEDNDNDEDDDDDDEKVKRGALLSSSSVAPRRSSFVHHVKQSMACLCS